MTTPGKAIGRNEVYRYTNGRFLLDEKHQCDRRYVGFDLDRLCELAASAGESRSPVASVDKMEGGFSKALLMTKEDGTEVIAKVSSSIAGPVSLTAASEVAVMRYVKSNTSFPVPEVFAWSSDASNPIGVEYIIMEKAPGEPLFKMWDNMDGDVKMAFIKQLTILESQLAAIQFPAYGGLYLSESSDIPLDRRVMLPSDIDGSGSFFIGPSSDRSWMDSSRRAKHLSPLGNSLSSYGEMLAKREIHRIRNTPRTSSFSPIYHGTPSEEISLLESAIAAMRCFDSYLPLSRHSQPRLWHTDLHMGNIFVSSSDPSQIVSLIDWQSIQVAPFFLQARWSEFVTPPRIYQPGPIEPRLPDDYDDLDPEAQDLAEYEWGLANRAKVYELANIINDDAHHAAMNLPSVFRELFIRCGEVWKVGCVPLRECLIELSAFWTHLGLPGACPFGFREDEIRAHEAQFEEYRDWHELRDLVKGCLGTDDEGWVSPEREFEEVKARNEDLLGLFVEKMAGEKTPEEARRMWPFVDDEMG